MFEFHLIDGSIVYSEAISMEASEKLFVIQEQEEQVIYIPVGSVIKIIGTSGEVH